MAPEMLTGGNREPGPAAIGKGRTQGEKEKTAIAPLRRVRAQTREGKEGKSAPPRVRAIDIRGHKERRGRPGTAENGKNGRTACWPLQFRLRATTLLCDVQMSTAGSRGGRRGQGMSFSPDGLERKLRTRIGQDQSDVGRNVRATRVRRDQLTRDLFCASPTEPPRLRSSCEPGANWRGGGP